MGYGVRSMFMHRRWHGGRIIGHPEFRGSPFFGEGQVIGHDQLDGIDRRTYAQAAARLVGVGLDGFDADIEDARRGLGAMVSADLAPHFKLTLTEFSDA